MADKQQETNKYLLNGPDDWEEFEEAYAMKLAAEQIQHLGKLKDPKTFNDLRIEKPHFPRVSDYMAKVAVPPPVQTRSQSVNLEAENAGPTFKRGIEPAKTRHELLEEDLTALNDDIRFWKLSDHVHERERQAIKHMIDWIVTKGVNPDLYSRHSPKIDKDNISELYKNLEEFCELEPIVRQQRASAKYFAVLSEARKVKTGWATWATNWEKAIKYAQLKSVPEVTHAMTWFQHLIAAFLETPWKGWMETEYGINSKAINDNTYRPVEFAVNFRQRYSLHAVPVAIHPRRGNVGKGAFPTIFDGQSTDDDGERQGRGKDKNDKKRTDSPNNFNRDKNSKRQKGDKGKDKKGKDNKKQLKRVDCVLCGITHANGNTTKCFTAFPENKPQGWNLSEEAVRNCEERIEENKEARRMYHKLKASEGDSKADSE